MGGSDASVSSTTRSLVTLRPRLQLGSLGVTADEEDTLALLRGLGPAPLSSAAATSPVDYCDVTHITTGYFNVTREYEDALLTGCDPSSSIHVVTAAPSANGFFGAAGVAGAIPAAYSEMERAFYEAAARAGRLHASPRGTPDGPGIALYEYARKGWTFHAKGLWRVRRQASGAPINGDTAQHSSSSSGAVAPCGSTSVTSLVTLVGSPNFGRRSAERDLELQVQIDVDGSCAALVAALCAERDALFGVTAAAGDGTVVGAAAASTMEGGVVHCHSTRGTSSAQSLPPRSDASGPFLGAGDSATSADRSEDAAEMTEGSGAGAAPSFPRRRMTTAAAADAAHARLLGATYCDPLPLAVRTGVTAAATSRPLPIRSPAGASSPLGYPSTYAATSSSPLLSIPVPSPQHAELTYAGTPSLFEEEEERPASSSLRNGGKAGGTPLLNATAMNDEEGRWPSSGGSSDAAASTPCDIAAASAADATGSGGGGDAGVTVQPVGKHLGPHADVWARPDRTLQGWSWHHGAWIRLGRRLLAAYF